MIASTVEAAAPVSADPGCPALVAEVAADFAVAAWAAALQRCRSELARDPQSEAALYLGAVAALAGDDLVTGCELALTAHRLRPDCAGVADLLATVHAVAGLLPPAVYYHKLARVGVASPLSRLRPAALVTFDAAIAGIGERPLLQRAVERLAADDLAGAVGLLHQHLYFFPADAEATVALAGSLFAAGRYRTAIAGLRAARHRLPDNAEIASLLGRALTQVGKFSEARICHHAAIAAAPDDVALQAARLLDRLVDPDCDPAGLAHLAAAWSQHAARDFPAGRDDIPHKWQNSRRITVGVLLARCGADAEASMLAEILRHADRRTFTITGFGCGSLAEAGNTVFQAAVDDWRRIAADDPLTFAAMVRSAGVDILLDASGFATPRLLAAFHVRMAPCQIGWGGLPLVPPLACLDAVIGDDFLDAAPEAAPRHEAGRPVPALRLASGSVLGAAGGNRSRTREPETGGALTFAADASLADLHPGTVAAWSEILHRVPGSVLLLRDNDLSDPDNAAALLGLFGSCGVSHRVQLSAAASAAIFAEADIGLLPGPQPRPATAAAMLDARLPLVCPTGPVRHTRQAASLLHHAGLAPPCIAMSWQGYVDHAVSLAQSADRRRAFQDRLGEGGGDWRPAAARHMQDLERLLLDALHRQGKENAVRRG
jgi:predicted O-linked N-acetylglucosamine transferase (SPINDLY family)